MSERKQRNNISTFQGADKVIEILLEQEVGKWLSVVDLEEQYELEGYTGMRHVFATLISLGLMSFRGAGKSTNKFEYSFSIFQIEKIRELRRSMVPT